MPPQWQTMGTMTIMANNGDDDDDDDDDGDDNDDSGNHDDDDGDGVDIAKHLRLSSSLSRSCLVSCFSTYF